MLANLIGDRARAVGLPAVKRGAGVVTRLLPIPQPTPRVGPGSSARLSQASAGFGHRRILFVPDAMRVKLGLLGPLPEALAPVDAAVASHANIAGAPIAQLEEDVEVFKRGGGDAIVACRGGSTMDAAKLIGPAAGVLAGGSACGGARRRGCAPQRCARSRCPAARRAARRSSASPSRRFSPATARRDSPWHPIAKSPPRRRPARRVVRFSMNP